MQRQFKTKSAKKREKWNLFGGEKAFDSSVLKGAHIEIFDTKKAEIEGCLGVYEYNDNYLKLKLKKGALIIEGSDFNISTFENGTITVSGKINNLEFCQ